MSIEKSMHTGYINRESQVRVKPHSGTYQKECCPSLTHVVNITEYGEEIRNIEEMQN